MPVNSRRPPELGAKRRAQGGGLNGDVCDDQAWRRPVQWWVEATITDEITPVATDART